MNHMVFWIPGAGLHMRGNGEDWPLDACCVDLDYIDPTGRYGKMLPGYGWEHVPKAEFPIEFQAALKLLNID